MTDSAIPWNNPEKDREYLNDAYQVITRQWMKFNDEAAMSHNEHMGISWTPPKPVDLVGVARNLQEMAEAARAAAVVTICAEVLRGNISKRAGADILKMHPHTLDRNIDKFMEAARRPELKGNPFAIPVLREFRKA